MSRGYVLKFLDNVEQLAKQGSLGQQLDVAKEIVELSVAAQRRVFELFSSRGQASVEKLKAVA